MVALVIAGIVLLGLATYFVNSSRSFSETERVARQIENGRYAAAVLSEEIRHAGFYGEVGNVVNLPTGSAIGLPASLPNPCDTAIANVKAAVSLPIQGVDNDKPTCLTDYVAGTDVLVVRRSNTETVAYNSSGPGAGDGYYTQVAFCATAPIIFQLAQSGFTIQDKDCASIAPVRQYHVYIFYIGSCSVATGSNGFCSNSDKALPTLKRAELVAGGTIKSTPLVEGIENLQIEYGLDTTNDGAPDSYTANPTSVTQWSQVAAMRLHILSRGTDVSPGFTDTKTYALGLNADGSVNSVTPAGSYRRHNYTEVVRVQNTSQRLEPVFP